MAVVLVVGRSTSSKVLSRGFSTHCRFLISFSRAFVGSFPPGSCGDTSPHTTTDPSCAKKGVCGAPPLPRDARSVHGDRGSDWNDVDFLLFGVTTEEIRLLQSRVIVARVTHPPRGGAGTFVGRDANVVRETVVATRQLSCLRARRPVDLCGHPLSLGSSIRRERGIPCRPRRHPRCPRSARRACPPGPPRVPVFAASSSLKIERRFMRRVDRRVQSRGSGCPVHKKQLLLVLVVWTPPRKKRDQEQHALTGNKSASAASSSCDRVEEAQ